MLQLTAIFADTHSIFFSTASVPLLSCLVCLGRFHSFVPQSFQLTSQLVLARSMAALFFAGGNRWRPCPLFVRALYRAWLLPHPPHASRGRACRLTAICNDQSSSVIEVSGIKYRLALAAAREFIALKKILHVPCIIFLKLKCARSFVFTKEIQQCALALQKNVITFFARETFYCKCLRGEVASQRWQKKYWRWTLRDGNTFL